MSKFSTIDAHGPCIRARFGLSSIGLIVALFLLAVLPKAPAFSQKIDGVPAVPPGAVGSTDPIFYDTAFSGIRLVFNDQFEEALTLFEDLQQSHPDHPAPYFFKAATYQAWMGSFRVSRFWNVFEENIGLAISKGTAWLKRDKDPWSYFYTGAAYGFQAVNRFRDHDWINAYLDAGRGVKNLKKVLTRDPILFDIYLGLGAYHYWRTSKSSFLRLITFWIPDRRDLGLRQLEFAFEHGSYASIEAGYGLVVAYFDYGRYEKAMAILDRLLEKKMTPAISDLYYKGRLLIKFEKWPEAESVFREILARLENYKFTSVGYQVACMYWIAEALTAQNNESEAIAFTEMALTRSVKRHPDSEMEGPFENFEEIKMRLERLHRVLKENWRNHSQDRPVQVRLR
jgi:tetratricopeptide (TPR) repeat protein